MIPDLAQNLIVIFLSACTLYMVIHVDRMDTRIRRMKIAYELEIANYKQMLRK